MRWHWGYGLAAAIVFAIEVLIALFVRDGFVRPYLGDVLAVVLVYLGLRSITRLNVALALTATLAIALTIELGQLFGLIDLLGLRGNRLAHFTLGGTFDTKDLLCYAAGGAAIALAEAVRIKLAR
ncbi:DUF2809 domain-containing protein [Asticcacaulis sp. AC402]|uniref:ribosomal maturation YjgA family protein n=1 Tax=Asticcacaulis sp. AC402 TaxID=1282361 RepID=UPI0003C3AFAB|nr:DUF2809 domain-containing protein [Asticcacaulis sp. AC402]ESQ73494.1 hypothetical protein ABAC402_18995 [Asticcacaulis sp. AC402]